MIISNKFISFVQYCGEWFLVSPDLYTYYKYSKFDSLLLEIIFYCTKPRSKKAVVMYIKNTFNSNIAPEEILEELLTNNFLLIDKKTDKSIALDYETEFLWKLRQSIKFADYSDEKVVLTDRIESRKTSEYLPAIVKNISSASLVYLNHPCFSAYKNKLSLFSELIFWSFGNLKLGKFWDTYNVMQKAVPSQGARHPFDLYIINSSSLFETGTYYYNPLSHTLSKISDRYEKGKILLSITIVFERYQWRYRHSLDYLNIFTELGHVIANLNIYSEVEGINIRTILNPEKNYLDNLIQPLTEEVLAQVELKIDKVKI